MPRTRQARRPASCEAGRSALSTASVRCFRRRSGDPNGLPAPGRTLVQASLRPKPVRTGSGRTEVRQLPALPSRTNPVLPSRPSGAEAPFELATLRFLRATAAPFPERRSESPPGSERYVTKGVRLGASRPGGWFSRLRSSFRDVALRHSSRCFRSDERCRRGPRQPGRWRHDCRSPWRTHPRRRVGRTRRMITPCQDRAMIPERGNPEGVPAETVTLSGLRPCRCSTSPKAQFHLPVIRACLSAGPSLQQVASMQS